MWGVESFLSGAAWSNLRAQRPLSFTSGATDKSTGAHGSQGGGGGGGGRAGRWGRDAAVIKRRPIC